MKKTVLILLIAFVASISNMNASNDLSVSFENDTENTISVVVNPFCMAIVKGDLETVKKLIELGENVNQKSNGMTPVMFAARYNRVEILEILIEKGADLNAKSKQGYKALKYAQASGAKEAVKVIENALSS